MRIVIDGNACPRSARENCKQIARTYRIPIFIITDPRMPDSDGDQVERVAIPERYNRKLPSLVRYSDVVVTDNMELAANLYENVLAVVHPAGIVFNRDYINRMRASDFLTAQIHDEPGLREPKMKKLTGEESDLFSRILRDLVKPIGV